MHKNSKMCNHAGSGRKMFCMRVNMLIYFTFSCTFSAFSRSTMTSSKPLKPDEYEAM